MKDNEKRKFSAKIHGFSVWETTTGDKVVFHEPLGVEYHGMGKAWIHGLNTAYSRVSDMLTMMGVILDLYGHQGVSVFMRELNWFIENAPERIGKKMAEGQK